MTKLLVLILIAELWGNAGQIFYKKTVNKIGSPNLRSLHSYTRFVKKVVAAPMIWFGLGFITISLVIWLVALALADLSLVFPIDSMQYIITLITAHIFLNEKINKMKLIGTLLIVGGIIFVAMS